MYQDNVQMVTIVMPVYNAGKYLKESIDSILNQTYRNFSFLILNDGSTDHSEKIILSYTDSRIVYVRNNGNIGLVATLNKALELVQTPYFARMDADDISHPERIKVQMDYLQQHPEIGVCGTHYERFGEETGVPRLYPDHEHISADLLFVNGICHPSVIIRTHLLKDHHIHFGGFQYTDTYGHKLIEFEDYGLWHKLKSITTFANIDQVLLKYRREGQNFSVQNKAAIIERKKEFAEHWLKELSIEADKKALEVYYNHHHINKENGKEKIKILIDYFDEVRIANKRKGVYSEKALEDVINKQKDRFFYIVAAKSLRLAVYYMYVTRKLSVQRLLYALKVYLNKKRKK